MAKKQKESRLEAVIDKSLTRVSKVFVYGDEDSIQVIVIEIKDNKLVVMPCDRNGNPVEDSSKHQNFSLSSSFPAD